MDDGDTDATSICGCLDLRLIVMLKIAHLYILCHCSGNSSLLMVEIEEGVTTCMVCRQFRILLLRRRYAASDAVQYGDTHALLILL
jgi:hypothetical protein